MKRLLLSVSILVPALALCATEMLIDARATMYGGYEAPAPRANYGVNIRVQDLITAAELNYADGGAVDIYSLFTNVKALILWIPSP